jgi:hypothetical protein
MTSVVDVVTAITLRTPLPREHERSHERTPCAGGLLSVALDGGREHFAVCIHHPVK